MYHLYQQQHQPSCHANASEQHLIRSIREVQYHSQNHTMPRSHTYLGIVLARVIYESRQTTRDLRRFRAPWLRITPGQDTRVGGFSPYVPVSNNRAKSIHEYNWNCRNIEQERPWLAYLLQCSWVCVAWAEQPNWLLIKQKMCRNAYPRYVRCSCFMRNFWASMHGIFHYNTKCLICLQLHSKVIQEQPSE